jgi:hypothetical protein
MKSILYSLAILVMGSLVQAQDQVQKYDRVLVFQGGGFQAALYLGILDGVEAGGQNVDAIVSTCGSSIAADVVNAFQTPAERLNFLKSERFYNFLQSLQLTDKKTVGSALMIKARMHEAIVTNTIPDFYNNYLMSVPFDLGISDLDKPFGNSNKHIVMVASETRAAPSSVGDFQYQMFVESYFTDGQTDALLEGFNSPMAAEFPKSNIKPNTKVFLGKSASIGARASISDMFYMQPLFMDDRYFMAGSIDLYPIEVAKRIGKEVIMGFSGGFDHIVEEEAAQSVFGFDNNKRLRNVNDQYADYWVDISDESDFIFKKYGFNPKPNFRPWVWQVEKHVPNTYKEYVAKVQGLYDIGYQRGQEAISKPKNDKSHIRSMDSDNSSDQLRKSLKR